jgi:amino acid adenylation domain-containing protein
VSTPAQRGQDGAAVESEPVPLSFAQEPFWIQASLDPVANTVVRARRILGSLNFSALERAVDSVVARHETLRTIFRIIGGAPVQIVRPHETQFLERLSFDDTPRRDRERAAAEALQEFAQAPFDLRSGPLFRAAVAEISATDHIFAFSAHHIIFDDWSTVPLWRELSSLYSAFASGGRPCLPDLPLTYTEHARSEREFLAEQVVAEGLAYWKTHLSGPLAPLRIPPVFPRPSVVTSRADQHTVLLDAELTSALRSFAAAEQSTLYMVLLAAFQILLARYTLQEEIVLGSAVANRTRVELEPLIGCFINTLVLRGNASSGITFREFLARTRAICLGAYAHQHVPYRLVATTVRPDRNTVLDPMFRAMFIFHNAPQADLQLPGARTEPVDLWSHSSGVDLALTCQPQPASVALELLYKCDLFEPTAIRRMLGHLETLLRGAVAAPDSGIANLPLLSAAESKAVVALSSGPAAALAPVCLHEAVRVHAKRSPSRAAVVSAKSQLSYSELEAASNRLARHLSKLGAGCGVRIAVFLDRSPDLLIAVLAVLKTGATCVPLDMILPRARLEVLLQDASPEILVANAFGAGVELPARATVLLDRDQQSISQESTSELPSGGSAEDAAFLLYTSGTTGGPKGVLVSHHALVNHACAIARECAIVPDDRILQFASISFDAALEEIFPAWFAGAAVVIRPDSLGAFSDLFELCETQRVTILDLPTAYWHEMVLELDLGLVKFPASVRLVIIGGERAIPDRYLKFREIVGPQVACVNTYGITETAVSSTLYRPSPEAAYEKCRVLPIGRPLANTRLYVLDSERRPAPFGVPGEIYIGGPGVAIGYLNNPDLTAERFLPDPFRPGRGERVYRTGDLGCLLEDGNFLCLGRIDQQLKIRGFRVEPGELERALCECPLVRAAAVVGRGRDGEQFLAAYVVARTDQLTAKELRLFLRRRLPEYMVPAAFVFLSSLPLTSNGKVDTSALPTPDFRKPVDITSTAPRTHTEEVLVNIWSDVLGLDRFGVDDDFFELGGHSLKAVQVVSRVDREFEIRLPLRLLFDHPTIAGLAPAIDDLRNVGRVSAGVDVRRVARDRDLPLSLSQEGLVFLHTLNPGSAAFHVNLTLRILGPFRKDWFERAVAALAERQEALRTRFFLTADGPVQRIVSEGPEVRIEDLRQFTLPEREPAARRLIAAERGRAFRLHADALFRFLLVQLSDGETLVTVVAHHAVVDGWACRVLLRELFALYVAERENHPAKLPELSLQYADYVDWQRRWMISEEARSQLAYWKGNLSDPPPALDLPFDSPRPAVDGEYGDRKKMHVDSDLVKRIHGLCARERATPFMILLAAWVALLHRYTGQADIAIGVPAANRNRAEWELLVGYFANTLVLRTDLAGDPSFQQLLARVRATCLEGFANQELPFEKIVSELNPNRDLSRKPLIQVMFVFDNAAPARFAPPELAIDSVEMENKTAKYDLTLYVREARSSLQLTVEYRRDLFRSATIQRMLRHFRTLLTAGVAQPETPVSGLPLCSESERRTIVTDWNRTEVDAPLHMRIHDGFERQAKANPNANAVMEGESRVTYGELNRQANQLAHYLRQEGLRPGAPAAVFLDRGTAAVRAVLAIAKAGGVFLPLDPSHPASRTRHILEDSGSELVLTTRALLPNLPATAARVVCLDTDWQALSALPDCNPRPPQAPESACYLMYTSGSAGIPKGAVGLHRGAVNRICWVLRAYPYTAGEVQAHKTTLSFIDSLWEIFAPLWAGVPIAIIPDEEVKDPRRFVHLMRQYRATRVSLVPSHLSVLLDSFPALAGALPDLTHWTTSGEAIPLNVCRRFLERMPGRVLVNLYGCSEASGDSTYCELNRLRPLNSVPIGRPISNTQIYILDRRLQPVPVGVAGELYIAGEGVARGYHNRPELTAERFLPDPFSARPGATLYRTGDLARFSPDGNILYLGRIDNQVKVRGQRVELGEIEAVLSRYPDVRQAVVHASDDELGQSRLVAYIVAAGHGAPPQEQLRAFLQESLPPAMVPSAFVVLDHLPLTANGKLSRRDLPSPSLSAPRSKASIAPRDDNEARIAEIWRRVLDRASVGVTDDFFEIGGDSLGAVRVLAAVEREFGTELSVSRFLRTPTIEHLTDMLLGPSFTPELVIPVQTQGVYLPLFCVHPNATDDRRFDALAAHLGPDQPLYGIRIPGSVRVSSNRQLAPLCLDEMRKIQPSGPYFLAGYCAGGLLAFEIALQLVDRGEAVAFLGLLESFGPAYVRPDWLSLSRLHMRKIRNLRARDRLEFLRRKVRNLAHRAWAKSSRHWSGIRIASNTVSPASFGELRTFPGSAILFRSRPEHRDYDHPDPSLGWSPVMERRVEVVEILGGHEDFLKPPFVAALADQLASRLEAARLSPHSQTAQTAGG